MNNDFNGLFGMFTADNKEESQTLDALKAQCKTISIENIKEMRKKLTYVAMMRHGVEASQEVYKLMGEVLVAARRMFDATECAEHIVNHGLVQVPR